MFCPEDGTNIPLTEEIHGQYPIYHCPECDTWWVYNSPRHTPVYEAWESREEALEAYDAAEADVTKTLPDPYLGGGDIQPVGQYP